MYRCKYLQRPKVLEVLSCRFDGQQINAACDMAAAKRVSVNAVSLLVERLECERFVIV